VPGDCREVLRHGPEAWADVVITDPGVGSLADVDGWQRQVPGPQYWSAILRAAKPGAHLAIFAGRKTFHRVVTYAEDAGWEMRDTVMWLYPKGMPMALDIGQAVDKKMGGDGEAYFRTIGSMTDSEREAWIANKPGNPWYGWGTELRPTWEPIVIMRRPISKGSVADNVLAHGTGAMNIDATRIDSGERDAIATHIPEGQGTAHGLSLQKFQAVVGSTTLGRWPADAIISHAYECDESGCVEGCPVGMLDLQDPDRRDGPSRFFYCPKSSRREKDIGLGAKGNKHKAVKPAAVTDWLLGLLSPPGGVCLDPFAGTCSTGLSVVRLAGGCFVGIDQEEGWLTAGHSRLLSADDLDS
jgi:site-specific DNA-methyltransferase (adenine-specific)